MYLLVEAERKREQDLLLRAYKLFLEEPFGRALRSFLSIFRDFLGLDLVALYEVRRGGWLEATRLEGVLGGDLEFGEGSVWEVLDGQAPGLASRRDFTSSELFLAGRTRSITPVRVGEGRSGEKEGLLVMVGKPIEASRQAFVGSCAEMLSRAWRRGERERKLGRFSRLFGVLSSMIAFLEKRSDDEGAFDLVLRGLNGVVPFDVLAVFGLDWASRRLELVHLHGSDSFRDLEEERAFFFGRGLKALSLEVGKAIIVNGRAEGGISAYMAVPVNLMDLVVMVFVFQSRSPGVRYSKEDADLVELLGLRMVQLMWVWSKYRAFVEVSTVDELTGLYNRRHFERRLKEEFERARREGTSLSLAMLDVDHFKRINDTFGHIVGDTILSTLGDLIRRSTRDYDVPCRYGGEEFAVLMPGTSLEVGLKVAERIRRNAERVSIPVQSGELRFTLSGGVASYPAEVGSAEELVDLADRRLYLAKAGGRNRIVGA